MDFDDSGSSSDDDLSFYSPSSFFFGRVDSISRPHLRRRNRRGEDSTDRDMLNDIMYILTGDQSESLDMDMSGTSDCLDYSGSSQSQQQPTSLLDLAAHATAKYCCSNELDGQTPPLDEALLRKVAYWSFPQDVRRVRAFAYLTDRLVSWKRAVSLVQDNKIKEMWQVGFMATAYLTKHPQNQSDSSSATTSTAGVGGVRGNSEIRVSLLFEKQKIISSTCSECKNEIWCEHVLAAVIHRIKNPDKVTVHAPMTETLSTLDRDQLQKLLQYAVNEDPAGILGKVFKHFSEIRDTQSEMNRVDGAPDPTYGGLQGGEKSQWDLSLDLLHRRISADLDSMIRTRSYFDYSEGRTQQYYPDNYDVTLKMQSKFFSYISPVLELVRQEEYMSAAEVLQRIINITASKMKTTTRSDCPNLSRLWRDLSHIHALLVLRTEDIAARNLLISAAGKINVNEIFREHILLNSQWAELPSLTQLYPAEAERLKAKNHVLVESLVAKQLPPFPESLTCLLDGTDTIEKTVYDEDLIVMLARLEAVFYFERDRWYQKIVRLGFVILHKLAIQAQKDSVIGQCTGSPSSSSSTSTLLKLFCPGPASLKPQSSSDTTTTEPLNSSVKGRGKTTRGPSKNKHPAKRFKSSSQTEELPCVWTSGQIAHAMLYTLRTIIASPKVSSLDSTNRKVLVGFCLQALELSRHRMQAVMNASAIGPSTTSTSTNQTPGSSSSCATISQLEHDWCLKLETSVCEYLAMIGVEESHEAVSMYIDSISNIGTSFYTGEEGRTAEEGAGGAYPLVLLEVLCNLCTKNNSLKDSKSKQLVKICSEILLGSTSCHMYNSLLKEDGPIEISRISRTMCPRKHREFAVKKFHVITETFLSLVGTDTAQDIDLLIKILKHLESVRSVALLKLISKDLRMHVWRFKEEQRVIEAMLRFSIHACREALGVSTPGSTSSNGSSSSTASTGTSIIGFFDHRHLDSVEREFIFSLARKLDISSLVIFSNVWQDIFTCRDLQELVLYMELKDNGSDGRTTLPAEIRSIIDEFYEAKRPHDEDACTLLTRFFTPGDANYKRIAAKILANAENYHAGALFNLARLQLSVTSKSKLTRSSSRRKSGKDRSSDAATAVVLDLSSKELEGNTAVSPMDDEAFAIVEKAFERIGPVLVTPSILDSIEWVFNSCVAGGTREQRRDITRGPFYAKLVWCICQHAKSHREVVLKVLQSIESVCGGISSTPLARHESILELGSTLILSYKEHFMNRFKDCGHAAYTTVINEMIRAQVECKHYIHNGDTEFDRQVVEYIRIMHSTKKKLIKMLAQDFPGSL